MFLFCFALWLFVSSFAQLMPVGSGVKMTESTGNGSPVLVLPSSHAPNTETTVWALPENGGTSGNCRAPNNNNRYQRTEYLITPAEMAASGFTSGLNINSIGFLVQAAGVGTLTGTLNIYLMNTTNTSYSLGTTWTTTGFTQVSTNASYTIQVNNNAYYIVFSGLNPFTYTGSGVYVAWEFSSPSGTTGSIAATHYCNYTASSTLLYNYYGATSSTALTGSKWRPATLFSTATSFTDVLSVTNIYTLGKAPYPYGTPTPVSVRVTNAAANPSTFDLTITVKDVTTSTTRYTFTQSSVSVPASSASIINFTGWTPGISEDVYITATASTVGSEDWTANNSMYTYSTVNTTTFSNQYGTSTPNINYGFTSPNYGIFAAKYTMNGPGIVNGSSLLIGGSATATGNVISAVALNSSGVIVATSATYTILATDLGTYKSFTFANPPMFNNEVFYVGMLTTAGTAQHYPLGMYYEVPQRSNEFYTFLATGGTPSSLTGNYKPGIDAKVAPYVGVVNPTAFTATAAGAYQINLGWALNAAGNSVMVAYNTTNTFGTPTDGTTYGLGTTLTGGGTIISSGTNTTFNHTGLNPMTGYYYKAWSVNASNAYSAGTTANATTTDLVTATVYPFNTVNATGYVSNSTFLKKGPWMNISTTANDTCGRGYVKFDLSSLPSNALITKATVNYYNFMREATSSSTNNIYPLTYDPLTTAGATLYADCGDGTSLWSGLWGGTAPTWMNCTLNSDGLNFVSDQLANGWAGFGIVRGSTNLYRYSGYNDATYKPYLYVEYHIPTAPIFSVTPVSNNFEQINLGIQSLAKVFTVKNKGVGNLIIDGLVLEGVNSDQFILTDGSTYPRTLDAGASYTVSVVFKPTSVGAKTADLRISENENDHLVTLSGSGYLNGPLALAAAAAPGNSVNLSWNAALPLEEIRYDDNTAESNYWVGTPSAITQLFYTKITIPVSGVLNAISVYSRADAATAWQTIQLCPESAGMPNLAAPIATYSNIPVTSTTGQWILESLPTPLNVTAGQNYYILTQWPDNSTVGPYVGTDTHNDHFRCAWTGNGGSTWNAIAYNFMMRAYMTVAGDNSVRSFSNYTIHRGTVRTALTTSFPGVSGTTYNDNTTAPSTTYYYMVSSEYTNGSANSDTVTVTTFAACAAPSALSATGITSTSATLGWSAGTGTAWQIEWGPAGFSHGSGTMITTGVTNPYVLSGLTPGVQYSYYVRTDCGSSNYSLWAGPYTFTTSNPMSLSASVTNVTCADACNGSIDLTVTGGTAPYTYQWSEGSTTQDISNLCEAIYYVTVTDNTGTTQNGSWTVTIPAPLAVSDGSISISVNGGTVPYTYAWSNGATTANIAGLTAGSYFLTVTDAHFCSSVQFWSVLSPTAIGLSGSVTNASCPGTNNGAISLTVAGGTAPYSFLWSNGATTQNISGLAAGDYMVTVTDANNCSNTGTWSVGLASAVCANVSVTGDVTTTVCFNATQTITVAGGGNTFVVYPTGSATFIAGAKISYLPGTKVMAGGYMVGRITLNGTYCNTSSSMVTVVSGQEETPARSEHPYFTLYPNPTNSNFTLVQKDDKLYNNVKVEIFNMNGFKVNSTPMTGERQHEFNTVDLPSGLYFVKVTTDGYTETIKLVKTK